MHDRRHGGHIEAIVNRGRTPIAAVATSCCSGNCSELAISVTRPGMIAHRIDWQRGGSRIAFADSHGAPSHPYAQRSSSRRPTRCAIVALRPRMCRTLRSDKELTLRADSARSLATDVRPLPGAFLPFRQRSLSAQLRRPRPQSATSAIRRFETSLKRLKCAISGHCAMAWPMGQIVQSHPSLIALRLPSFGSVECVALTGIVLI